MSLLSAPRSLGSTPSPSPTATRWPASCGRTWPRANCAQVARSAIARRDLRSSSAKRGSADEELDVKLIVGCRLTFKDGSPDLLCYPQDRAAYGRLCRLLTVGKSDRVFKQKREVPPHPVLLPEGRRDARTVLQLGERTAAPSPSPLGERAGVRGSSAQERKSLKASVILPSRISWSFPKARSRP